MLAVFERHYGREHYEVAVNLNNLAANYHQQGRPADAEPRTGGRLTLKETLLGANHPDVALTLNNLAVLCKQDGRYDEAAAPYQLVLAVYAQRWTRCTPRWSSAGRITRCCWRRTVEGRRRMF